ncbi:unnamed protein product [Rhizophagus irregularis]|uniref:MATA-HMG n=1 Tax=Rhizophagus irregularis TaxID=588596 RepID=A0A1B1EUE3_9GLOM|nr:MATA-HMG [Rhizophagus irregularis]ANQ32443.1 MATA-HMG [Rhizophagus irregularis]PKK65519.1 hypothetical protein RhiirC2_786043 [Rhizophagus irregularis]PKY48450.1 hypothetical protein RhiirA4_464049 [Rhizophagus irregularis]CAB4379823.1 unnamed protein product [Rhizophagus irregularis]
MQTTSSKSNKKTNIKDNPNDILTNIKPTFPPIITINDLIKPKSPPNSFIVYRMALMKEYRNKNCKLPSICEISKIAKKYWDMEPKNVKDYYASLVKDAKSIYNKFSLDKFSLDNYMEYIQNQKCDITYDAVENINENLHILTSDQINNDVGFSTTTNTFLVHSFPNYDNYELNSTPNDQEYIRILEQIIDRYLL